MPTFLLVIAAVLLPIAVTYGMATESEVRVLAVVVAALVAIIVIAQPMWGLVAFTTLLFTRPEDSFPALAGMRLTLATSILALMGLLLRMALNKEPFVRSHYLNCVFGLTIWAIITTFSGSATDEAAQDLGKLAIMAFLVVNLARDVKRFWVLVWGVLGCTVYLAIHSQWLYFNGVNLAYDGMTRSTGTGIFGDPNDLAVSLSFGLGLAMMLTARFKGWVRIVLIAVAIELSWAIFMTNSRGGMLAFLTVVAGYFIMSLRQKSIALVLAFIAVQLFLLVGPSRMTSFDNQEASANSRFWFWSNAVDKVKENPIMGVGFGKFAENNGGMVAHNTFAQSFAETGFPGYCFFIGCIYYCYRRRLVPQGEDESAYPDHKVVLGMRLALAGFLVGCFFITRTFTPNFYLFLALPVAAERVFLPPPKPDPDGKSAKRMPDAMMIMAIAFLSILFIKIVAEQNR